MFSFVFEQRFMPGALVPETMEDAVLRAQTNLTDLYEDRRPYETDGNLSVVPRVGGKELPSVLRRLLKIIEIGDAQETEFPLCELLSLFVTHCFLLPTLSVAQRAQFHRRHI